MFQNNLLDTPCDSKSTFPFNAVSPWHEMVAYEALWDSEGTTYKRIADAFSDKPNALLSDLVDSRVFEEYATRLKKIWSVKNFHHVSTRVRGAYTYPSVLKDARYPVPLVYFQGDWSLVEAPALAVVGSREPSIDGIKRAKKIAKLLVESGFVVVSGLARGIDTAAHESAIASGGKTVAVIGTPLSEYYPKENRVLQDTIRDKYLLVSSVPFIRYSNQNPITNRLFFPERNKLMSALTLGTIIVEAGETSGSLIQARAALEQGRKLFILQSCFENKKITWPDRFEKQGAIRVRNINDIIGTIKNGGREA